MPELPEVETIASALRNGGRNGPPVTGLVIRKVHVLWERSLAYPAPIVFGEQIAGQRIMDVSRRAKFLVIILEEAYLFIHLRMSGDIRVEAGLDESGEPVAYYPHDRMVFHFDPTPDGTLRMAFNDPRKFGRVWLVKDPDDVTGMLGPEPFSEDFSPEMFFSKLQKTNRQIKPLLLDQRFIAGMGNIYTDEALHIARIHPLRISSSLSAEEAENLWNAIRYVLSEGIRRNGASFDWVYRGGDFQNSFQVYQRSGATCYRCGAMIMKITVGQRGTHFCPVCQELH